MKPIFIVLLLSFFFNLAGNSSLSKKKISPLVTPEQKALKKRLHYIAWFYSQPGQRIPSRAMETLQPIVDYRPFIGEHQLLAYYAKEMGYIYVLSKGQFTRNMAQIYLSPQKEDSLAQSVPLTSLRLVSQEPK